jgi:beclin
MKSFEEALSSKNNKSNVQSLPLTSSSTDDIVRHVARLCSTYTCDEVQPICLHCSEDQYESLRKQLKSRRDTQKRYQDFLNDLVRRNIHGGEGMMNKTTSPSSKNDSTVTTDSLKREIEMLETRLSTYSSKRVAARNRSNQLRDEIKTMELEAERCWDQLGAKKLSLESINQRNQSIMTRQKQLVDRLEILKQTNVFNDTFFIWFDGPFGTINNLRLGRLPSQPVEYSEINAAWGEVAMLLATLEKRHKGFKFQRFRVVPMGSYSKIGPYGNLSRPLPLYWDGGWRKGPYNRAMVAILNCLDELGTWWCFSLSLFLLNSPCVSLFSGIFATSHDRTIHMPYVIRGKTIGAHSIELGDWYNWTTSLKYFLTNLKWLVAWSSKQH